MIQLVSESPQMCVGICWRSQVHFPLLCSLFFVLCSLLSSLFSLSSGSLSLVLTPSNIRRFSSFVTKRHLRKCSYLLWPRAKQARSRVISLSSFVVHLSSLFTLKIKHLSIIFWTSIDIRDQFSLLTMGDDLEAFFREDVKVMSWWGGESRKRRRAVSTSSLLTHIFWRNSRKVGGGWRHLLSLPLSSPTLSPQRKPSRAYDHNPKEK